MELISTQINDSWQSNIEVETHSYQIELALDTQSNTQSNTQSKIDLTLSLEDVLDSPNTYLLRLQLTSVDNSKFYIETLKFSWLEPTVDFHGLYFGGDPRNELSQLPFWTKQKNVGAQRGLPYMSLLHRNGENRVAYGLLDQLTETKLEANLSEITRCYHMSIQKPANQDTNKQTIPVDGTWEEIFFISFDHNSWDNVLKSYVQEVTAKLDKPLLPVPNSAYDPVFCTWTAIHHDVSHAWIMKNAPLAADLGFKTWLTDDGWFLDKGTFGDYEKVGAWLPNEQKFPDFKQHVADVKALGFRYLLWVSPFMVGVNSKEAQSYKHLLTTGQEKERFQNLSPWHDEVSDIVKSLLKRLIEDYELDGLKIDFIDSISIDSERMAGASEQTLGASIFKILDKSIEELLKLQPELLIEFRNSYTNLASRHYANMYRSSDIPFNFSLNLWQAVMMRLLVPDRAVHMDPILWHPEDSDENVALHLINGIASVPMVSVELADYPQKHLDMIRYWIGFYNSHRDTIIHGDFQPEFQPTHIPLVNFIAKDEVITGLYNRAKVKRFDDVTTQWILNASPNTFIEFDNKSDVASQIIFRDKYGNITGQVSYDTLPTQLDIEIGGSLEILIST